MLLLVEDAKTAQTPLAVFWSGGGEQPGRIARKLRESQPHSSESTLQSKAKRVQGWDKAVACVENIHKDAARCCADCGGREQGGLRGIRDDRADV